MKLIVGLGNPGREYVHTRHNAGFEVMDAIADHVSADISQKKFKALIDKVRIGNESVLLMKPQTYMNNSGEAVRAAMDFYHLTPQDLLVIYDDMDMPVGRLRLRQKGSAGGHNGLKNIIAHLGTDQFPRIRVGVGAPQHPEHEMVDWVIGGFTTAERKVVDEAVGRAVDAAVCVIEKGVQEAQNRFN